MRMRVPASPPLPPRRARGPCPPGRGPGQGRLRVLGPQASPCYVASIAAIASLVAELCPLNGRFMQSAIRQNAPGKRWGNERPRPCPPGRVWGSSRVRTHRLGP
jgi:hypothetical protein